MFRRVENCLCMLCELMTGQSRSLESRKRRESRELRSSTLDFVLCAALLGSLALSFILPLDSCACLIPSGIRTRPPRIRSRLGSHARRASLTCGSGSHWRSCWGFSCYCCCRLSEQASRVSQACRGTALSEARRGLVRLLPSQDCELLTCSVSNYRLSTLTAVSRVLR